MTKDMTKFPPTEHRAFASRLFSCQRSKKDPMLHRKWCQSCGNEFHTVNETKMFCNDCFHAYMEAGLYDLKINPLLSCVSARGRIAVPLKVVGGRVIDKRGSEIKVVPSLIASDKRTRIVNAINKMHY